MKLTWRFLVNQIFNKKPIHVYYYISNACNLKCKQCNIWKYSKEQTLNAKQRKNLIKKLHDYLGKFQLNISGGEPFIQKDLLGLIDFASKLDLKININTNGTLINEKIAKKLSKYNKNLHIIFSIDGSTAKLHDYLRNQKGTYKKALQSIDYLNKYGFNNYSITSVISNKNLKDLSNLAVLTKKLNAKTIVFQPLDLYGFQNKLDSLKSFKKNFLWPKDLKQINRSLNDLIKLKSNKKFSFLIRNSLKQLEGYKKYFKNPFNQNNKCSTSKNTIYISRMGNVGLCSSPTSVVGNILDNPLNEILKSKKAKQTQQKLSNCYLPCKIKHCNTSRGLNNYIEIITRKLSNR